MKYAISCRRNYIHEIQEYTDIEGMKKWFLGKTSEICSNMESAREKEAVSIIEKQSPISGTITKDISLDEVSREVDISPYYFSKLFKQETGGILSSILQKFGFECKRTSQGFRAFHQGDLCGIRIQRPQLFQQDIQKYEGVTPSEFRERLR